MNRASTAFVDVLFLIAMVLILTPRGDDLDDPPLLGVVVVEITWPGRHDVDLWVRPPGLASVGYSARQAATAGLVFDDLGHIDVQVHREVVVIHEARDGHYIANIHLYRLRRDSGEVAEVDVTLWVRNGVRLEAHWTGHIRLENREEATAIQWDMRDERIIPGSERHDFISIKGARS